MSSTGLQCRYLADDQSANPDTFLAKVVFDPYCIASAETGYISTGLKLLDGEPLCEVFTTSASTIERGKSHNCAWAKTDELMLLALWANESLYDGLQQATQHTYDALLQTCREHGYPFLVKVWNYFADINRIDSELERYRQFCMGRFDAFATHGIGEDQFPAACALGHGGGDLLVYALVSKTPVQHIENPLQASAYRYPAEYGPRSPSFARATLLTIGETTRVYVSGTASVVGYLTRHPGELELQIQVTLENLDCLLKHIASAYQQTPSFEAEVLKVYVRNPADLAIIKAHISQAYPAVPTVYVAAAICRSDLLLEVDGIWKLIAQ